MLACPECRCSHHKVAYDIGGPGVGTGVAIACMRCEFTGPFVRMTFPPDRRDCIRAAELWDQKISEMSRPRAKVLQFAIM